MTDETQDETPEEKPPGIVKIELDPNPKGENKSLGGSQYDDWNNRLFDLVVKATPGNPEDLEQRGRIGTAVCSGMVSINPADPIEGALVGLLIATTEAALSSYRRGHQNIAAEYFEAGAKYLALADKASRTVAVLTERLDQHRGRGQQQITVKHVTVNADQAMVADNITTGKQANGDVPSPANLLAAGVETPMDIKAGRRELTVVEGSKAK